MRACPRIKQATTQRAYWEQSLAQGKSSVIIKTVTVPVSLDDGSWEHTGELPAIGR